MEKDPRYDAIKPLVGEGLIKSFADIFKYMPKTRVANDLGVNVYRFSQLIDNVEKFRVRDLYQLARLLDLEPRQLFELIDKEYEMRKGKKFLE